MREYESVINMWVLNMFRTARVPTQKSKNLAIAAHSAGLAILYSQPDCVNVDWYNDVHVWVRAVIPVTDPGKVMRDRER